MQLKLNWARGDYEIVAGRVRPRGPTEAYAIASEWMGRGRRTNGGQLAVSLAGVRLPDRNLSVDEYASEVVEPLLGFYRQWGPLGLAHHEFGRQSHVPQVHGEVWVWDVAPDGYRRVFEALDGEREVWPQQIGRPAYPGGPLPVAQDPMKSEGGRPPTATVFIQSKRIGSQLCSATEFYGRYFPNAVEGRSPQYPIRFPNIVVGGSAFWDGYQEPLNHALLEIGDFQDLWREVAEASVYRGDPKGRTEWVETNLMPYLRKVHPRLEVREDGMFEGVLWAPSLLDAAYFELAAVAMQSYARICIRCGKPFVTPTGKRQACPKPKACDDYVRKWKERHPREPLSKLPKKLERGS